MGSTLEHEPGELVDGEVRPLAGPVDGEVAQADETEAVEVAVDVPEQLAGDLGGCIRADGPEDAIALPPRRIRIGAVDAAGRREDELGGAPRSGRLEQRLRATDVVVHVADGVLQAGSHAGLGRKVDDDIDGLLGAGVQSGRISEVALDDLQSGVAPALSQVPLLDLARVEGVVVVQDGDVPGPLFEQEVHQVAADEAGAAGHERMPQRQAPFEAQFPSQGSPLHRPTPT